MSAAPPQPTRLILTNLPPSLPLPLLRTHLARCPPHPPTLTDLKILLKPDGTSRRIAFVGFKDAREAERVLKWVDGTWVQGSVGGTRIGADWAKDAKDAPRPHKRAKLSSPPPAAASKSDATPTSAAAPAPSAKSLKDDASRFAEFMSVMGPRKGRALEEASEPVQVPVPAPVPEVEMKAPEVVEKKKKKKEVVVEKAVEQEKEFVKDSVVDDEEVSDMEYMTRRMKRKLEVEEDPEAEVEAEGEGGAKGWVQDEDGVPAEAATPTEAQDVLYADPRAGDRAALLNDSPRLFVRNLGFSIAEGDLRDLFYPFGEIEQIHIPLDTATRSPKGLAYISYVSPDSALAAFEALDRSSFQGRLLHILPAVSRNPAAKGEPKALGGVRGDRNEIKKQDASKSLNWGTLYMNSDAVMSSIADRLNISKSELLDPSSENAAVRVALAETHVIAETKQYFENEGINLEAFTTPGPRSSTAILVKNIPYNTSGSTLSALFSPFGTVTRLLLPPAGTMAIVEMADTASASSAWRGLVYKKIGASILYLEKAPAKLWSGDGPKKTSVVPIATMPLPGVAAPVSATPALPSTTDEPEAGATLFVKNLSFATTTPSLTSAFSPFPSFLSARVQTKPDPKKAGATLSMGFGFVVFRTEKASEEARKSRDGFVLDGHRLEIKFAHRGREKEETKSGEGKKKSGGTTTKIIVKNVPFEVTKKELRELFSAYGALNSVRLPRKIDNKTRGFAFLDFVSRRDAEQAFSALEHTHILGRHLVLQWADEGTDEVEKLRAKAGEFSKGGVGGRKGKFKMGDDEGKGGGGGGEEEE